MGIFNKSDTVEKQDKKIEDLRRQIEGANMRIESNLSTIERLKNALESNEEELKELRKYKKETEKEKRDMHQGDLLLITLKALGVIKEEEKIPQELWDIQNARLQSLAALGPARQTFGNHVGILSGLFGQAI